MTCGIEGKHNPQKSCHDAVIQQELWCSDCTTAFIHRAWAPGEGVREHNCGSELLETVLTYPGQFSTEVTTRPLKEAALAQRTLPAMDVKWDSVKWPDGSTYEGLVRDEKCDVRGVFSYPNGDRYAPDLRSLHTSFLRRLLLHHHYTTADVFMPSPLGYSDTRASLWRTTWMATASSYGQTGRKYCNAASSSSTPHHAIADCLSCCVSLKLCPLHWSGPSI
jgi:hypothetical protein